MLPWAVLWDMDGTLVDTAELHFSAWRECCARQGRDFTEADFQATFGRRNPEILRFLLGDHLTDQEVASLGEAKEQLYRAEARKTGIELLPGARNLLTSAREHGAFQAIGSSAPRANHRWNGRYLAWQARPRGFPDRGPKARRESISLCGDGRRGCRNTGGFRWWHAICGNSPCRPPPCGGPSNGGSHTRG